MTDLVTLITRDSDLSDYVPKPHGLPSNELFVSFIAQRLETAMRSGPKKIGLRAKRFANHVFKLAGEIDFDDGSKRVSGEIVWLPRLGCFRGHVFLDIDRQINQMLEEDAAACRICDWVRRDWEDSAEHTHCQLCWTTISYPGSEHGVTCGYTVDGCEWLCPTCHDRVVVRGQDHPWHKEGVRRGIHVVAHRGAKPVSR